MNIDLDGRLNTNKMEIFIGGCPRSGTTMLGSMLGVSDSCITTPESHFKQTIPVDLQVDWKEGLSSKLLKQRLKNSFRFNIWQVSIPDGSLPATMTQVDYRFFLYELVDSYARKRGKLDWSAWIDHTPQNFQEAFSLASIFPRAKFIHLIRDPRAVFSSVLKMDWGPTHVSDFVSWWTRKISYPLAFELTFPDRVKMVRYEDLVLEPEIELKKLCEFSGLDYQNEMISGSGFELPSYTISQHKHVGERPIWEKSVQWKNDLDDSDILYIEKHLGDLMALFKYEKINPISVHKTLIQRVKKRGIRFYQDWINKRKFNRRKKKYIEL